MTEATAFAVNSFTPAAMATRTTSRRSLNAKAFAMMLLAFAIWLLCTVIVPRMLRNGTLMLTHRNVKNLSSADVTATKITLTTNDHVKMLVSTEMTFVRPKLVMLRHRAAEL